MEYEFDLELRISIESEGRDVAEEEFNLLVDELAHYYRENIDINVESSAIVNPPEDLEELNKGESVCEDCIHYPDCVNIDRDSFEGCEDLELK